MIAIRKDGVTELLSRMPESEIEIGGFKAGLLLALALVIAIEVALVIA